jgi:hypothetical protein
LLVRLLTIAEDAAQCGMYYVSDGAETTFPEIAKTCKEAVAALKDSHHD